MPVERPRNDIPAAFPLALLITGLAAGPLLVNPDFALGGVCAISLLLLGIRRRGRGVTTAILVAVVFLGVGLAVARRELARQRHESAAFAALDPETFAVIEAPVERGWAERDGSWVMRCPRFTANGVTFAEPISLYVRFQPPPIAAEPVIRVEASLRKGERGYTASVKSPRLLKLSGALPWWHPAAWNRALARRLAPHAEEFRDEVALAEALVLGRGERLSEEMRESFRRGGTYHLLVFSGLQIALAAAGLAALLRWLRAPRAADWLLLAFAVLAPPFIGATASVSRASIAIALYAVSRIAARPTSIVNLWCVAAMLRLLFVPGDLTDPSFHLTYAGAGALLFLGRPAERRTGAGRVAATVRFALAVEIAIAPLTLFHFHQVTLGGSVVTMLMSPVVFAMLLASIVACAFPSAGAFGAIALLHRVCGFLNSAGLSGSFASPPLAAMLVAGFGAVFALTLPRGSRRTAALSLALLVPSVSAVVRSLSAGRVDRPRVAFYDVGQGDAIAVRTPGATLLVDGGPERRILALLADSGIRRIDAALLTHAHPDHCEGLAAAIEELRVGQLLVSPRRFRGDCAARLFEACRRSGTPVRMLRDGQRLRFDGAEVEVFVPEITFRRAPENNASVVLRVTAGGRRFLLTGDVEKEAELYLGDRDFTADVLKVAHHGSRTSTSGRFLEAVAPRTAVISCGRSNSFGHPHPSVLEALRERRIRTFRTDRDGSVEISVQEGTLYARRLFD